jgi:hypothetical protein
MRPQPGTDNTRVVNSIPFVEQLARRVAATMPHSIDIGDLVQDGVIGLIDAANRFDEGRGIKFETVRRAACSGGDDRRAPQGCLAAWRAPSAP